MPERAPPRIQVPLPEGEQLSTEPPPDFDPQDPPPDYTALVRNTA